MLTIPGVQLAVRGPLFYRILDQSGRESASEGLPLKTVQDWRDLRAAFINLNLGDSHEVAGWLANAGYLPADAMAWTSDYISNGVSLWLRHRRDVAAWLMEIPQKRFRDAITIARSYHARIVFEADQEKFKRELKAPAILNARTLQSFLVGAGIAPNLHAFFAWGPKGRPSVTIDCDSPIEALALSIHIDRNFSVRQWVACSRCGTGFERERGTDKYCSNACRNYAITNARREKIRLLIEAENAWSELAPEKRRKQNQWDWISKSVRKKGGEITADWARIELGKIKSKGGK